MAKPAVTLIVFALCSLGALAQSDNVTIADEDDINNSSISLTPTVVTGITPSTLAKLKNEEEPQDATDVNEPSPTVTENKQHAEDVPPQPPSSTFPPLVHNDTPKDKITPTESPTTMTQELAKSTMASRTKYDKPLQNAESNPLSDVKPTPTVPSSSNTLASNSLLLLSIVLMWKFYYY